MLFPFRVVLLAFPFSHEGVSLNIIDIISISAKIELILRVPTLNPKGP